MLNRRTLLQGGAVLIAGSGAIGGSSFVSFAAETVTLPFENGERPIVKYPQKRPMIGLTSRPPQLETPFTVFNENVITPNDAFFVRYHLAGVPLDIDPDKFTVEIKGKVDKPSKLSLAEIRKMPALELVAVNQCSGNSRGFFMPRVAGGQLGNGAMGNARWRGVPLMAVLDKAGVQAGAKQVVFGGMDGPVSDRTPDFAKALDIDHARDGEVMLAYSMNGQDLPFLNGFPLRLAQGDSSDQQVQRALVHHKFGRRRQGEGGRDNPERHRVRRRQRHQGCRRLDGRREGLGFRNAGQGYRQVFVPRMEFAG